MRIGFLLALGLVLSAASGCALQPQPPQPVIALLTDYGTQDSYVGELKGAILSANGAARIEDLTHAVPAYDVREGAWLLALAARNFPAGTVFTVVVDPGVGTARRSIAVRSAKGHFYVGPDNGLFTPVYEHDGPCEVRELTNRSLWRDPDTSTTFHGRDIYGPVSGHLAAGRAFEDVGPPVADPIRIETAAARREGDAIVAEVVHVDVYGNVSTNAPASLLGEGKAWRASGSTGAKDLVFPRAGAYGEVPVGSLVLVIDSKGHVELAENQGHLGHRTGWAAGTRLRLEPVR